MTKLATMTEALKEIAKHGYGIEGSDDAETRAEYWSDVALRLRRIAAAALKDADNVVRPSFTTTADLSADDVIEAAIGCNIDKVLVLGVKPDGELFASASTAQVDSIVGLMERFKHGLYAGDFGPEQYK